jgi:hypothetical protein
MIVLTITITHVWFHLVLFPLLIVVAELEYWLLRTETIPTQIELAHVNRRCSKVHQS